jgi:hypothetical protein
LICASHTTIRSAHPPATLWDGVKLADDQGATPVGLDGLDLEAVTGADPVGRAERRHAISVRSCA